MDTFLLACRMRLAADLIWLAHLLTSDVCTVTVNSIGCTVVMENRHVTTLRHATEEAA